ncbi:hypothetical protein G4X40_15220 [Rhodococcus sp. D2-41]|uniref:Uncharacterized protein n=1 Tax=Speluncibacter jeojiensis TaxID=2710754 RepID=A0A9X4M2W4_9ACTN|nr:hypothetical protein [Rhodococcus sp. D2-41]MDG3011497.1 hypothetical protein [Rhodococcus sp. D2-41]MDG3015147.1 hypothetical protein [Corynebacteriales bacterium D3-21]
MAFDATPTVEQFRALARSSPWRWSTLDFDWRAGAERRRMQLRRPDSLRVEFEDGTLDEIRTRRRPFEGRRYRDSTTGGKWKQYTGVWANETTPTFRDDGLVSDRLGSSHVDYDLPTYGDYHFVAALDPAEFADASFADDVDPSGPVALTELELVDHHGRPAWQAVAEPTTAYDPRCPCCALLAGEFDEGWDCPGFG